MPPPICQPALSIASNDAGGPSSLRETAMPRSNSDSISDSILEDASATRATLPAALPLEPDHVLHRVDERQVGERLGEVAQVVPGVRIDLLAVQLERTRERQQLRAELARLVVLTDLAQRGHHPEGADRERALLAAEPVVGLLHLVAQHEPVDGQLVADRLDRRPDTWVVRWEEPHERREQKRCVERRAAVVLREHTALVEAVGEDVLLDLLGGQL